MAYYNQFEFAPAPWLPIQDRQVLDSVGKKAFDAHIGKAFDNPDFELSIVPDVNNYFAIDLFCRIRCSDVENKKLVVILPSPENAVFISVVENLNKYQISCRNVHVFFLYEYANEKGEVAPWQSPYSRSGHFMRYFYNRLDEHLRMPMSQIHYFTKENVQTYSDELEAVGGADVAYTALSWSGGIGAIDADGFPAGDMDEFRAMGSRLVTPMPEMIAHDSLRGMFGCSGDIANVPPCAATIGPKDLIAAKEIFDVEHLTPCGGRPAQQKFVSKLALFAPVAPNNPGSLLRTLKGTYYMSEMVATPGVYAPDEEWLIDALTEIEKKEKTEV